MPDPVEFSVRIRITPGGQNQWSRVRIDVGSVTVCDDYEGSLPAEIRAALPTLLEAHSKAVGSLLSGRR